MDLFYTDGTKIPMKPVMIHPMDGTADFEAMHPAPDIPPCPDPNMRYDRDEERWVSWKELTEAQVERFTKAADGALRMNRERYLREQQQGGFDIVAKLRKEMAHQQAVHTEKVLKDYFARKQIQTWLADDATETVTFYDGFGTPIAHVDKVAIIPEPVKEKLMNLKEYYTVHAAGSPMTTKCATEQEAQACYDEIMADEWPGLVSVMRHTTIREGYGMPKTDVPVGDDSAHIHQTVPEDPRILAQDLMKTQKSPGKYIFGSERSTDPDAQAHLDRQVVDQADKSRFDGLGLIRDGD